MGEANIDNALVDQKNTLWTAIHNAKEVEELERVIAFLDFAAPLWEACNYGYKVRETRQLLRLKALDLIDNETNELLLYRRNTRLHNFTVCQIAKLKAVVDRCSSV